MGKLNGLIFPVSRMGLSLKPLVHPLPALDFWHYMRSLIVDQRNFQVRGCFFPHHEGG